MSGIYYALVVGMFVGAAAGYLGSIMVSRRMALVGDALSHVALPGLALGMLFGFNPFAGAFALLAVTVIVTWYIQKTTALATEAIIGVLFVLALAIGILITPRVDLLEALFGDVANVTALDAAVTILIATAIVLIARAIYGKLVLAMISGDLATSNGVNVNGINLVYLLLVAAVVAIGIKEVGTLLVGAVVIVPAAAARVISRTLREYALVSSAFGAASAISGIAISNYVGMPAGPLVVIVGAAVFAACMLAGKALHIGKYVG